MEKAEVTVMPRNGLLHKELTGKAQMSSVTEVYITSGFWLMAHASFFLSIQTQAVTQLKIRFSIELCF